MRGPRAVCQIREKTAPCHLGYHASGFMCGQCFYLFMSHVECMSFIQSMILYEPTTICYSLFRISEYQNRVTSA